MNTLLTWEETFPKGYGHTSIAFLRRCPWFEEAKKGNFDAASFVVKRCVKKERISKLRDQFPNAVLLPVLGTNQLPLALAHEIGLPVLHGVYLLYTVKRKHLCAIQRLLHKPFFIGHIQKGLSYILVDDVVTQGGTIAALRSFIMLHGGVVVAVVALAYAIGSHAIAPTKRNMVLLMVKFGMHLINVLRTYLIIDTAYELTNSQVKYLLRFGSIRTIKEKLEEASSKTAAMPVEAGTIIIEPQLAEKRNTARRRFTCMHEGTHYKAKSLT